MNSLNRLSLIVMIAMDYSEDVGVRRQEHQKLRAFWAWVRACGQIPPLWASCCRLRLRQPTGIFPILWVDRRLRESNTRLRWSASGRFSPPTSAASLRAVYWAEEEPEQSQRWYQRRGQRRGQRWCQRRRWRTCWWRKMRNWGRRRSWRCHSRRNSRRHSRKDRWWCSGSSRSASAEDRDRRILPRCCWVVVAMLVGPGACSRDTGTRSRRWAPSCAGPGADPLPDRSSCARTCGNAVGQQKINYQRYFSVYRRNCFNCIIHFGSKNVEFKKKSFVIEFKSKITVLYEFHKQI